MADRNIFVDYEFGVDGNKYLAVHDGDTPDTDTKGRESGKALRKRVSLDPKKNDTLTWSTKTGQQVNVDFGSLAASPFTQQSGTSNSLTMTVKSGTGGGRYKYTLTLLDSSGNTLASEDPQIIVDDSTSIVVDSSDTTLSSKVSVNVPVTISGSTL